MTEQTLSQKLRETAWLIEMSGNDAPIPRWWHPIHGWVWDANKAIRFARKEDADACCDVVGSSWRLGGKATEHVFTTTALDAKDERIAELEKALDAAYLERNKVVRGLASQFPCGVTKTSIEGWEPEWHNCLYIDLPTGQVSWHFHDREAELFAGLPTYLGQWDGHDTPTKYERVLALPNTEAAEADLTVARAKLSVPEDAE